MRPGIKQSEFVVNTNVKLINITEHLQVTTIKTNQ